MADQKARGRTTKRGFEFSVSCKCKPDTETDVVAYAFDGEGHLVSTPTE